MVDWLFPLWYCHRWEVFFESSVWLYDYPAVHWFIACSPGQSVFPDLVFMLSCQFCLLIYFKIISVCRVLGRMGYYELKVRGRQGHCWWCANALLAVTGVLTCVVWLGGVRIALSLMLICLCMFLHSSAKPSWEGRSAHLSYSISQKDCKMLLLLAVTASKMWDFPCWQCNSRRKTVPWECPFLVTWCDSYISFITFYKGFW